MLRQIAPIALAVFAANGALAQDTTQSSQAQTLSELQAQVDSLREEMRNNKSSSSEKSSLGTSLGGSEVNFKGFARLVAGQSSGDSINGSKNVFNPVAFNNSEYKDGDQFEATANESRLGMEILTPSRFGTIRTYVEGDFQDSFRLRHAYFSVGHWTVGQTDSVFSDAAPGVNTVDNQGPVGTFSQRRPLVAYRNSFGDDSWTYAVSLEDPKTNWGGDDVSSINNDRPDLVASLKKSGDWGHVAVAGASTSFRVKPSPLASSERVNGYAAEIGGSYNLPWGDSSAIQASYVYADGSNEYLYGVQGMEGYTYGVVDNEIETVSGDAWTVAYTQKLSHDLTGNVFYSVLDIDSTDNAPGLTSADYAGANVFWAADEHLTFGAEYVIGSNEHTDELAKSQDASAQRVSLLAQYAF